VGSGNKQTNIVTYISDRSLEKNSLVIFQIANGVSKVKLFLCSTN